MNQAAVHVRSGPSAFRADAARVAVETENHAREGVWIAVTTLLEHAGVVSAADRPRLLARALDLARQSLGGDAIQRGSGGEWQDDRGPDDAILLLVDDAHDGGAFNTALAMVDALGRADTAMPPVVRGRLLARRGRALARLGRLEDAHDQFDDVRRLGIKVRNPELTARALIGLASVAQMSGDYPLMESLSRRAFRTARRQNFGSLERRARIGIMIAAAERNDFDTALTHGWAVYRASAGHAIHEGEILQTFGQLMLKAGFFDEARAAFAAVMTHALPARILVPALGGLAMAAAETGRSATVRWVANQLRVLSEAGVQRYVVAMALLECSVALGRIGDGTASSETRGAAVAIAERHGFHEVTTRAEQVRRNGAGGTTHVILGGRGSRIAGQIASLEPGRLPDEVSVVAVPA